MSGGFGDIFWMFLMLVMLHPWLQQKMLDHARVRLMHKIEKQRGSRVILLVHRQETMSFLGIPIFRYIDVNDADGGVLAADDVNVPAFFRGTYALDFDAPGGCHRLEFRVQIRTDNGTHVALIATHVDRR